VNEFSSCEGLTNEQEWNAVWKEGSIMTVIPIVHCFDSNFVVPAAVAFHSLLRHAKSLDTLYVLHVIGRDLTEPHRELLRSVVDAFPNAKLEFHEPPAIDPSLKTDGNFSVDVFFKMAIPDIIKDDIAIVADVDVIYESDVADLYHELKPEEDYWLCGTADIGYAAWRGSGILKNAGDLKFFRRYSKLIRKEDQKKLVMGVGFFAMNLKKCREEGATQKWFDFARTNICRIILPEQDVLNICSWPKIKIVSSRYMAIAAYWPDYEKLSEEAKMANPAWDEMYANPVQIHFATGIKPWRYPDSPLAGKWFDACVAAGMLHRWRIWFGKLTEKQTQFMLARKIIDWAFSIGRRTFRIVLAREAKR
jgi:lipopolysaccharide biosynthesis glycosyltransferase